MMLQFSKSVLCGGKNTYYQIYSLNKFLSTQYIIIDYRYGAV